MKTITYYITRDSNCNGELSDVVVAWYRKPIRCKLTRFEKGYVWMPSDAPDGSRDPGMYGPYNLETARKYFKTIPDTDLELIKCEQQSK